MALAQVQGRALAIPARPRNIVADVSNEAILLNVLRNVNIETPTADREVEEQAKKEPLLRATMREAADPKSRLSKDDIITVAKLVSLLNPKGKAPEMLTPFGGGGTMLSQTRGRKTATIDTLEHYAVAREVQRIKQQYLKTKLDGDNDAIQRDRERWSAVKIEDKVTEQIRAMAV